MSDRFDVVVVGGSVAGAATAALLARRGSSVLVLDKASFPRDKPCGEGILPHGAAALERLGVSLPEATEIRGLFFRRGAASRVVPFPRRKGLAMRRLILDNRLLEHARRSGAVVRTALVRDVEGSCVRTDAGTFEARVLVGADGPNSVFHRSFGIRPRRARARVGFSGHFTGLAARPDLVEVAFYEGSEAYIAPVDRGLVLVSLLFDQSLGLKPREMLDYLRRVEPDRFSSAVPETPVLAAAPLERAVDRIAGKNWLLVGDSAGSIDPITGEGMSLALLAAEIAADTIQGLFQGTHTTSEYARRVSVLRRPIERLTRMVLFAARHAFLGRYFLSSGWGLEALVRAALCGY